MSSPLDHLVDVSLQASQRSGMAKQHLMDQFESKASFMSDQLQLVSELFDEATDAVTSGEPAIEKADAALVLLKKLTPHAVGAARSLGSELDREACMTLWKGYDAVMFDFSLQLSQALQCWSISTTSVDSGPQRHKHCWLTFRR